MQFCNHCKKTFLVLYLYRLIVLGLLFELLNKLGIKRIIASMWELNKINNSPQLM